MNRVAQPLNHCQKPESKSREREATFSKLREREREKAKDTEGRGKLLLNQWIGTKTKIALR